MDFADLAAPALVVLLAVTVLRWIAGENARARIAAERDRLEQRRPFPLPAVRVLPQNEKRPDPEDRPSLCSPTSPKEGT